MLTHQDFYKSDVPICKSQGPEKAETKPSHEHCVDLCTYDWQVQINIRERQRNIESHRKSWIKYNNPLRQIWVKLCKNLQQIQKISIQKGLSWRVNQGAWMSKTHFMKTIFHSWWLVLPQESHFSIKKILTIFNFHTREDWFSAGLAE